MADNMFPDSLFNAVKDALAKEYRPGTTITSPHSAERKALAATEAVLATVARHYEQELSNDDSD